MLMSSYVKCGSDVALAYAKSFFWEPVGLGDLDVEHLWYIVHPAARITITITAVTTPIIRPVFLQSR